MNIELIIFLSFIAPKVPHACLLLAGVGSLPDDAELRVRNEMSRPLVENMTNDSKVKSLRMAIE